jgi:hypothetical protein
MKLTKLRYGTGRLLLGAGMIFSAMMASHGLNAQTASGAVGTSPLVVPAGTASTVVPTAMSSPVATGFTAATPVVPTATPGPALTGFMAATPVVPTASPGLAVTGFTATSPVVPAGPGPVVAGFAATSPLVPAATPGPAVGGFVATTPSPGLSVRTTGAAGTLAIGFAAGSPTSAGVGAAGTVVAVNTATRSGMIAGATIGGNARLSGTRSSAR